MIHEQGEEMKIRRRVRVGEIMGTDLGDDDTDDLMDDELN